ncbi:hypothetical protein ACLKA6_009071 [Drosophila palustris]
MNPFVNPNIMSTIEHFKRLMIGEGQPKIQMQEKSNFDANQSLMLPRGSLLDWYAYQSLEATAQFLALHDDTFSFRNRMHGSSLPQPANMGAYNWKNYQEKTQNDQADTETEMWQLLGKNVCQWTMQPNGQPLVPYRSLVKMSGVEIACVLLAAHLLKHRQDPKENCMVTHYDCNELRSYVIKSDELEDVLNRCKQRECLTSFYNVIPYRDAPQPSTLPLPPLKWLLPKKSKREEKQEKEREKQQHKQQEKQKLKDQKELQVKAVSEPEPLSLSLPKPKPKPWQRYSRQSNGGRKRINPNHVLTEVWHPSAASPNYKLFNL